ncbi:MAG: hypothetical protein JWO38_4891 [Gemmataceae bacterium]|nr:hypothetical protein [Gemmataceae bacterium]
MSRAAGYHCSACRGERLHTICLRRHPDGKVTRARRCSACEEVTDLTYKEQAGLACPVCSNIRLKVKYTRHRIGGTVRVKACTHCGHRIRTIERYESLANS